ncbi:MAG: hypothetical protein EZS28_011985 [Streblomastix strix]|uniref:SH3 domain-containing protein n=1 Tax=Streblomastix strix TaxID=222440 RepID=A0A5J4WD91_9EUKA|nr:MAG: hypothetical protein EZS28_011985 [Streblomastix strix]
MLEQFNAIPRMSSSKALYEVISDFIAKDGDSQHLSVMKGDDVSVIKEETDCITVEREGKIGLVPKEILGS